MSYRNVIVFTQGRDGYALDLRWVREVRTLGHVTPVPHGPPGLAGMVNVRGAIVPIIDLHCLDAGSQAAAAEGDSSILIEFEGQLAALRVDLVDEVASLLPDDTGSLADGRGRRLTIIEPPRLFATATQAAEASGKKALALLSRSSPDG